jgi:hypothetical protein
VRAWEGLLEINPLAMAGGNTSVEKLVEHYKNTLRMATNNEQSIHPYDLAGVDAYPCQIWAARG